MEGNKRFKCPFENCDNSFRSIEELISHGCEEHSVSSRLYCAACSLHFGRSWKVQNFPSHWNSHLQCPSHLEAIGVIPRSPKKRPRISSRVPALIQLPLVEPPHTPVTATSQELDILDPADSLGVTSPSPAQVTSVEDLAEPADFKLSEVDEKTKASVDTEPPRLSSQDVRDDFSSEFYPFPNDNMAFFAILYLHYPDCAPLLDKILRYLASRDHPYCRDQAPKSIEEVLPYIPHIKNGVVINPNFGFPLTLNLDDTGKIAYTPVRGIFRTALRDPEIAKYITVNKVPVRRPDSSIRTIENAPIYSSHEFTTLRLAYMWAAKHNCAPIFVGDCVSLSHNGNTRYGFVRRMYTLEEGGPADVRVSVQMAVRPSDLPGIANPADYGERDFILTDEMLDVGMEAVSLQKCTFDAPRDDCVRVLQRYRPKTKKLESFSGFPKHIPELTEDQLQDLVVIFAELGKDELTVYRTKRYKDDVANISIKDIRRHNRATSFARADGKGGRKRILKALQRCNWAVPIRDRLFRFV